MTSRRNGSSRFGTVDKMELDVLEVDVIGVDVLGADVIAPFHTNTVASCENMVLSVIRNITSMCVEVGGGEYVFNFEELNLFL